jgi:hypothetical protein
LKRVTILIAYALVGCQSATEPATAALISDNSANAVVEITDVISSALGRRVTLSADVFSKSSLVTLEHRPSQTIEGRPATGLVTERPEQFELVRTNSRCALVRLKTGEQLRLRITRCRPEPADH